MRFASLASIAVLATLALGLPVDPESQPSKELQQPKNVAQSEELKRLGTAETSGESAPETADLRAESQKSYNGCMKRFVSTNSDIDPGKDATALIASICSVHQ